MEELVYLYSHVDLFLFVFVRIICALAFLPIMDEAKIPPTALGGISVCLSYITMLTVGSSAIHYNPTLIGFTAVLIKEGVIGIVMGFGIRIFFQVYNFVGWLWGTQGGLGMSLLFDPVNGEQVPLIGKFYMLGFSTIFLISGGYHWFIKTLVESFKTVPINQAVFRPNMAGGIVQAVSDYWLISFKIAVPILAILFIIDCGLGVLARAVPQMNMFVIGLPLKLILLFVLLVFTIGLVSAYNDIIIDNMIHTVMNIIQGMVP